MLNYSRYLVIGSDVFSLAAFDRLKKLHGEDHVVILAEIEFSRSSISLKGPGLLRGDANISYVREYNPNLLKDINPIDSIFYKNKNFRSFNGPSRPEKLLPLEEFFVHPRIDTDIDDLYCIEDKDTFLSSVKSRQIKQRPVKIERYIADEAEEETNFKVIHSGGSITCQHLIWGDSPYDFFKLCSDKRIFNDKDFSCHFTGKEVNALYVKFKLKKMISDRRETLFLPLSYTHEWGHFIGEFQSKNDGQEIEFVTFLDKEEASEEEIIKKIKILKRGLTKIYPSFKKLIEREWISLDEISLDFSDNLFPQISSLDYLDFVGQTTPMGPSKKELSHLARGLESLRLIEKTLVK